MLLPGRRDFRNLGKSLGAVGWLLLIAWWLYPLIFVCLFFYWTFKLLVLTVNFIRLEVAAANARNQ